MKEKTPRIINTDYKMVSCWLLLRFSYADMGWIATCRSHPIIAVTHIKLNHICKWLIQPQNTVGYRRWSWVIYMASRVYPNGCVFLKSSRWWCRGTRCLPKLDMLCFSYILVSYPGTLSFDEHWEQRLNPWHSYHLLPKASSGPEHQGGPSMTKPQSTR